MGRKKNSEVLATSFGNDSVKFASILIKETVDVIQAFKNGKIERQDANTAFAGINTVCNVAKTQVAMVKATNQQ